MELLTAIVGAGRMGSFVAAQLPGDVKKLVIDTDLAKAESVAAGIGAAAASGMQAAREADVIVLVLPAPATADAAKAAAKAAKSGALVLNMATNGTVPADVKALRPDVSFVDAKIIGHAISMKQGAPCIVVAGTKDEREFETIRHILPGYTKVVMGDSDLVPLINTIGSTEGIRAAVQCRKLLKQYSVPKEWENVVIYTVCAGTMRAYVDDDLGEFARSLADKFEQED